MRILAYIFGAVFLTACYSPGGAVRQQRPRPDMGQYKRPLFMQAEPTLRMPREDSCRSRLYLGLVGQHEGGILFASLPGRTRVIKPAEMEVDQDEFLQDMRPQSPFVQVREYLSGQILYAPSIQSVKRSDALGPVIQDRITVELDREGYVQQLSCR
ncbi:MAG: hypothetical protein V3U57_09325 [Robiginitomaculum sp.]